MNRLAAIFFSFSILCIAFIIQADRDVYKLPNEYSRIGPVNWTSTDTSQSFVLHKEFISVRNNEILFSGKIRVDSDIDIPVTVLKLGSNEKGARLTLVPIPRSSDANLILLLKMTTPSGDECNLCMADEIRVDLGLVSLKEKDKSFDVRIQNDPSNILVRFDNKRIEGLKKSMGREVSLDTSVIEVGQTLEPNEKYEVSVSALRVAYTEEKNLVYPDYWLVPLSLVLAISLLLLLLGPVKLKT